MTPRPSSLRETLASAVRGRYAALRNGRSHRKDQDALNAALGRTEAFLSSYPVASDERVREYCEAHMNDIRLVVPGNSPTALARLIMRALKPVKVIPIAQGIEVKSPQAEGRGLARESPVRSADAPNNQRA